LLLKPGILNSLLTMQDEKFRELLSKYNEGNCSPEEIAWLESAYLKWNDADKLNHSEAELVKARKLMWQEVDARTKPVIIRKLWPRIAAVASIIIFIGFGLFYNRYSNSHLTQPNVIVISSKAGEKKSFKLPDGTLIVLNGESNISYSKSFNITDRKINLVGEAYFTVVHNQQKPFNVHTSKVDIKDIGTIFNVKAYPNDHYTETSLIQGAIEMTVASKITHPILLHPGEKVLVNNVDEHPSKPVNSNSVKVNINRIYQITKITTNPIVKTVVETDWVNDRLTFNDESFEDMAANMDRWYDVKISFENPSIKKYRFVATFNNQSLTQVLDVLKLTRDFNYRKEGNVIVIY
jgi:ferric-dicitrate binding protein FerR (iron transport regulator)